MNCPASRRKPPRSAASHNLLKPCPSLARWNGSPSRRPRRRLLFRSNQRGARQQSSPWPRDRGFESISLQQRVGHEPHGQNRTRSRPEPKVRIQLSPANSWSLARFLLPVSKSRHLPRCARARPGGTARVAAGKQPASRQSPRPASVPCPSSVSDRSPDRVAQRGCKK